ncbi:O-antigen polymerase [Deinococcus soli (ex Cha et al. 2016)]|uniref:O-antigen polymerase n=1 Tax=Deinococcus soli (ex Cha et al. 2016) TaxID=1309411 RepID=UPI00166F5999|nr:O-antigen polymerase [Deinococcus soli (ex Cha et al. 2016)]
MKVKIIQILSPWIIGSIISLSGLISLIIPSKFYSHYLKEKNYMYLDGDVALYVIICTICFCLASALTSQVSDKIVSERAMNLKKIGFFSDINQLFIFLVSFLLIIYQILVINSQIPLYSLVASLSSGSGGLARQRITEAISSGKVGWISIFGALSLNWLLYAYTKSPSRFKKTLLFLMLLVFILSCIISISRDTIISSLIMLGVVYGGIMLKSKKINIVSLIKNGSIGLFAFLILFTGFDYVRNGGKSNLNSSITQVLGYFPASYNRLAAIIEGDLIYPNSNWGYYTTQFLWDTPVVNVISQNILDIPQNNLPVNSYQNWTRQFIAVDNAKLNSKYIWSTVFGFAYSDYRQASIVFFIIYGILAGLAYSGFKNESILSIIFYPLVVASIFKWWSIITISQRSTVVVLLVLLVIQFSSFLSYIQRGKNL